MALAQPRSQRIKRGTTKNCTRLKRYCNAIGNWLHNLVTRLTEW